MITARWTPTKPDVRDAYRTARRSAPFWVRHALTLGALADHAWSLSCFRYVVETAEQFVFVGAQIPERQKAGFVAYLPKRALTDLDAVRAVLTGHVQVRTIPA